MDRRNNPRLELHLLAHFYVQSAGDRLFGGMTVNISRSGVLIESFEQDCPVKSGDLAYVEIPLPAVQTLQQRCMVCSGTVVRVECNQTRRRIAVSIDTMQFQDAGMGAVGLHVSAACVM